MTCDRPVAMIRQEKVSVPRTAGVTNRVYRGAVPSARRLDEEEDVPTVRVPDRGPVRRARRGPRSPQVGPALKRELERDAHRDSPEAVVLEVATLGRVLV